jgi:molybdenum cofactor synthesis domain-containing protein
VRIRVVTVSDRVSQGVREDGSGPLLVELLQPLGEVEGPFVVPDDVSAIKKVVGDALSKHVDLVVTTGGTGISPRDVTPEAVRQLLERELPGIAEAIRAKGAETIPTAVLSRGVAGVTWGTLIVTLPGSTGGVRDGVEVLLPLAQHVIDQLRGGDHG